MAHIASPYSLDRNFHRSIMFTDSEIGLVLLLCSQITVYPPSIKIAYAAPLDHMNGPWNICT